MNEQYAAWIEAYVIQQDGKLLGKCHDAVEAMRTVFPELTIVRGHVHDAQWGKRGHFWLIDITAGRSGEIVDPTASQFPMLIDYEPWRPGDDVRVGKCMECGEEIWTAMQDLNHPPRSRWFCTRECEEFFTSDLNA